MLASLHLRSAREARARGRPSRWPGGLARIRLALAVGGLAACSGASPPLRSPAPDDARGLLEATDFLGNRTEKLEASVEIFGIALGTLESRVCPEPSNGAATVQTRVEASPLLSAVRRSSGEARTELGAPLQEPRASDYRFVEGDLLRHYEVSYRAGAYQYVYDNGGETRLTGRIDVPGGAYPHDMHSAMALIRAWRPRLGEQGHFFAVLGRRLWRVDLEAQGPEVIRVAGTPRLTQRIRGRALRLWRESTDRRDRAFSVWVSDDAERVPLHVSAETALGDLTVSLTGYSSGLGACTPARLAKR